MPLTDLSLDQLREYRPEVPEPADFDAFWERTLKSAREYPIGAVWTPVPEAEHQLTEFEVFDVRFNGWAGQPVAAWLLLPRVRRGRLPVVVRYLGYSGGRGLPLEHVFFPAAGYAHLVVDSRGQGRDTPDPVEGGGTQWVNGFMTRGIEHPDNYYYRRLTTDCVRAVEAVREHPEIDPDRVVVTGASQGGGLTLAVAGLVPDLVAAAMADVPFLCHFRRAAEIAPQAPYTEFTDYLKIHHRGAEETVFGTLDYFDGVHHAARADGVPALFSVALMDPICPPSTVYAAYHRYGGPAEMQVWRFGDHGGGRADQIRVQMEWLRSQGLAPSR
ncbi:acetylxylan esterase [Phaeacidiphilus oryzae]|uniref:acetylxylan esterase n=1 Tax=Phaeacidiphilus oryzae TaxID=348818 RepID=UPI000567DF65|nr:acetylxylan esterase [Phaeacidiphilus oryzae]